MKKVKILFFIQGVAPTPEDTKAATALAEGKNAQVVFRNARAVPSEDHSLETCDGVAGAVPGIYKKAFKLAKVAIAESVATDEKLSKQVGDTKAPKAEKPEAGEKESWSANKPA